MPRPLLLLLFMLLLYRGGAAQAPALYFDRITVQNGLSHNKVNCILQDKRGFLWIGTDDGLNRYDGSHFSIYKNNPGNNGSLSGNIITDLLEDEQQVLWIATADGGLTKYDYRLLPAKQFTQFKHQPDNPASLPVNIINKLLQDEDGYLWLATSGSYVVRFNKKTGACSLPVTQGTRTMLALTNAGAHEMWVGKQGGGLLKINTRTLAFQMDSRYNNLYAKLPHATVTSLYKDHLNNIWYGSWDSVLYQYNQQQQQELLFQKNNQPNSFSNDDILGFAEDTAGNLWMAGRYKGLHLYQRSSGAFFNYRHDPSRDGTIPGNQVNCVYIDRQGILWAGTNKGIGKSSPLQQQFTQFFLPRNAAEHITIHDLYETPQHDLWLATSAGIFVRKLGNNNFTRHTIRYKDTALNVTRFYQDTRGRLFIGTNFSLFQLDTAHMSVRPLANTAADGVMNHIIQSSIISIAEDTLEGRPVLITSPYGHYLTYYDWARQQWISRLDSVRQIVNRLNIKDNLIRKLYKSPSSGQLFIATAKEGLGVWQRQRQQFLFYKNDPQKSNVLSNNNVYDMVEDGQQQLWLTTYGGGLHQFTPANGNTVHVAGSNNLLEGIETDASGNVWMISNGNIDKYNPRVSSYASFQLPDIEKTGGVHGRIMKDSQGQLYVAGDGYFICFNPLAIKENRQAPAVFLTDFKISNQSHSHLLGNPAIRLPYDQNYISIEFAAPNFASGIPVQYQYRLNGLNENWTDIGTENKVSFSNLPPDTYTFSVRASNRPGTWYENATGIKIIIMSPFWQRWWFYVLALLAVAAVVYAVYHYRINEILNRQAIRNKIAQDLHDNIGSTLSSISVYSQVAKIYKQQRKEQQLQETLEKIIETSADMIAEMSDIVWTINPRIDSMDMILQRMESYAKPLLASKSIHCHFTVDEHIRSINPGMTQRKNLYLIFKESINNALKYAHCANLYVTLKKEHQIIKLLVQDDGVGFNAASLQANMRQSLSGNGLRNIFMRAKEMNGHCEVISSPGQGTTIKLQFPLT